MILSGGSPLMLAALAHTYGAANRNKDALAILESLRKLAKQKYVAPFFFAGIHVGAGENGDALEYLERAYEEKAHWLIYLHIDPAWTLCAMTPISRTSFAAYVNGPAR